jgi:hypothetical protein
MRRLIVEIAVPSIQTPHRCGVTYFGSLRTDQLIKHFNSDPAFLLSETMRDRMGYKPWHPLQFRSSVFAE